MEIFQYLGRTLDQTDDDWPEVIRNIMLARSVLGRLVTLLRYKGEDPRVSENVYRAVAQAILPYGSETWVLLTAIEK